MPTAPTTSARQAPKTIVSIIVRFGPVDVDDGEDVGDTADVGMKGVEGVDVWSDERTAGFVLVNTGRGACVFLDEFFISQISRKEGRKELTPRKLPH